jgi:pimeloyl-ACP methyl ester carboxylesterase
MTSIWYIHGFGASKYSFTWLQSQLSGHTAHFFPYEINESVQSCIDRIVKEIGSDPVVLIGHSLGGVIALACAQRCPNVTHLVTLSAPFGGLPYAGLLSLFHNTPIFSELRGYSPLLSEIRSTEIKIPHLAIIGTHSLPLLREPNDGVITVASQTALSDRSYVSFSLNHFEVLLSPAVASTINGFLEH